jgi:hypothetical protein
MMLGYSQQRDSNQICGVTHIRALGVQPLCVNSLPQYDCIMVTQGKMLAGGLDTFGWDREG